MGEETFVENYQPTKWLCLLLRAKSLMLKPGFDVVFNLPIPKSILPSVQETVSIHGSFSRRPETLPRQRLDVKRLTRPANRRGNDASADL